MLGKTLQNYKLVRLLGEGGMGSVHEAQDLRTGRSVALKLLHAVELGDDRTCVSRFWREAQVVNTIATPHIVPVLDTGTDPQTGAPFMVMEQLIGEDLHHVLRRVGPLPPAVALRIAAQTCEGLKKAHEAGVIHRDIKPANLFLSQQGGERIVVKVLDFGIAKIKLGRDQMLDGSGLTRSGSLLGSPLYMSPEQVHGAKRVDERTDLWSLGVVLYRALTGHTPHQDVTAFGDLIIAICSKPPRSVRELAPWVSSEVAALVQRALSLEPADRFQSAAEMLAAIMALLPGSAELHASMITPLSERERSAVEPDVDAPTLVMQRPAAPTPTPISAPPPRGRARWYVAALIGAAASLGVLALTAAVHSGSSHLSASQAEASPLVPAPTSHAPSAAEAAPPSVSAAPRAPASP